MAPPASHRVHRMPAVDDQAVPGHKVTVPGSQEYGDAFHVLRCADAAQAGSPHGGVFERLRRIGGQFGLDKARQQRVGGDAAAPQGAPSSLH